MGDHCCFCGEKNALRALLENGRLELNGDFDPASLLQLGVFEVATEAGSLKVIVTNTQHGYMSSLDRYIAYGEVIGGGDGMNHYVRIFLDWGAAVEEIELLASLKKPLRLILKPTIIDTENDNEFYE